MKSENEGKIVLSSSEFQSLKYFVIVLVATLFVFYVLQVELTTALWVLCLIACYYIASLIKKRPIRIIVDNQAKFFTVVFRNFLFIKNEESYSFKEIKCRMGDTTGARGAKIKELKVESLKGEVIFRIRVNQAGWSLEKIDAVFAALKS